MQDLKTSADACLIHFGDYVLHVQTGELFGRGHKVRLGEKPLLALTCLIAQAGEVVTREELRRTLWPAGTFVEFDDNLNATIKRLRETLHDSAEQPSYIETVPRAGYRFISPVRTAARMSSQSANNEASEGLAQRTGFLAGSRLGRVRLLIALMLPVVVVAAFFALRKSRHAPARPAPITLEVVRFTNSSGNQNLDFLTAGLSDQVTRRLRRLSPMQLVVASNSRSLAAGPNYIALSSNQPLGTRYVLDGRLQNANGELQLVTTLYRNGLQPLWTATYQLPIQEIFVEQDLARRIAGIPAVPVQPVNRSELSRASTANTAAYDFYMRGIYALRVDEVGSLHEAISFFRQALEEDPDYALPYGGLTEAYLRLGELRALPPHIAEDDARKELERGITLDDSIPDFYVLRARLLSSRPRSTEESEQLYRRAIQLDPEDPESHVEYALFLRERRAADALRELNLARQLDPQSAWINACIGWVLISAGRLDDAERQLTATLQLDPAFPSTMRFLGLLAEKRGRNDLASSWFEKAAAASGREPYYVYRLALSYAKSGHVEEVQQLLTELKSKAKREPVDPMYIQVLNSALVGSESATN